MRIIACMVSYVDSDPFSSYLALCYTQLHGFVGGRIIRSSKYQIDMSNGKRLNQNHVCAASLTKFCFLLATAIITCEYGIIY